MVDKKTKVKGEVAIYKFYIVQGDKVTRTRRDCPRCGKGTFMAEHKNRFTCGKCVFTEFTRTDSAKKIKK